MGLREDILATMDSRSELVAIPEWNCSVRVRSLTQEEMERWWAILDGHEKGVEPNGGRAASLVYMGCINDDGTPLFKPDDIPALGSKHPKILSRLTDAINKLSAQTEAERLAIEKKQNETTNSSSFGSQTDGQSPTPTV